MVSRRDLIEHFYAPFGCTCITWSSTHVGWLQTLESQESLTFLMILPGLP